MKKREIKFITYTIPKYPHALAVFSMNKKSITYIKRLKKKISSGFLTSLEDMCECEWYSIGPIRKTGIDDIQKLVLNIEENWIQSDIKLF